MRPSRAAEVEPQEVGQEGLAWGQGYQRASRRHSRACRAAPHPFLHLPRFIPDDTGPLSVSHASHHRSQTSQETVSFHFQLC